MGRHCTNVIQAASWRTINLPEISIISLGDDIDQSSVRDVSHKQRMPGCGNAFTRSWTRVCDAAQLGVNAWWTRVVSRHLFPPNINIRARSRRLAGLVCSPDDASSRRQPRSQFVRPRGPRAGLWDTYGEIGVSGYGCAVLLRAGQGSVHQAIWSQLIWLDALGRMSMSGVQRKGGGRESEENIEDCQ